MEWVAAPDSVSLRLPDTGKQVMAFDKPSALRSDGNRYRARTGGGETCPSNSPFPFIADAPNFNKEVFQWRKQLIIAPCLRT
jgi:hypothetical protein